MDIQRINTYSDRRFSQAVLNQHGCFLVDGMPYEIEILSDSRAVVRGSDRAAFPQLIEDFRFYTPHITLFYDEAGALLKTYPPAPLLELPIDRLQPSCTTR